VRPQLSIDSDNNMKARCNFQFEREPAIPNGSSVLSLLQ
jgi:hypothetical protein